MSSVDVPSRSSATARSARRSTGCSSRAGDDIERATGHRLRVVRALVRDPTRSAASVGGRRADDRRQPSARRPRRSPSSPRSWAASSRRGDYVLDLLARGKPVVTANKQLVARRGAELFAAASEAGVQLRFEASVCAAIPVIKVLRESLVVDERPPRARDRERDDELHPHRDGGRRGRTTRRSPRRSGRATPRPTRPTTSRRRCRGEDGDPRDGRVRLALRARRRRDRGDRGRRRAHVAAARELDMVVRLVGAATPRRRPGSTFASGPALVDRHHPLAAVEGAFNAVMLQGDAIREITLEAPARAGSRRRPRSSRTWSA